jgi:CheY-like chemotaxis protein
MDENIETCLLFDPTRMNQVLTNLTSNAIKFTPQEGTIDFRVDVVSTTPMQQVVNVAITDSGIGIAKENQAKIFKAFSQANSSTTREFGGTGLGLAISSELVETMGGVLEVSSTLNEGSTFFFTLTLQRCSSLEKLKTKSNKTSNQLIPLPNGLKILVAEDYDINRMLIENIFKDKNISLTFAINGLEAVDYVKKEDFDIIFMDINMPIMNGLDATKIIREELHSTTPIIALTANAISGDRERFMSEGMSDYISKPIVMDDLNRALEAWVPLDNSVKIEQTSLENSYHDTNDIHQKSFKLEETISIMIETLSLPQEITIKMLHSVAKSIDVTLQELKEAINNSDYEGIANIAHKLRGSTGSLHLEPLHTLFTTMEANALHQKNVDYLQSYDKIHRYYQTLKSAMDKERA